MAGDDETNTLRNKPVVVVGASTGAFGAVWLRPSIVAMGHAPTRFDGGGRLLDENLLVELEDTVDALVQEVRGEVSEASRTYVRNILGPVQTSCKHMRTLLSSPST